MRYSKLPLLIIMMSTVVHAPAGTVEPERTPQEQKRLDNSLLASARAFPNDMRLLVARGADVHAVNCRGFSALHLAGCGGNVEGGMFLVEKGANIHVLADEGCSPLHCAAQGGSLELVQFLVKQGADVHELTVQGQSAVNCIIGGGRHDDQAKKVECSKIMQFLLQNGVAIAPKDDKAKIADVLLQSTEGISSEQFAALCDNPERLFTPGEYDQLTEAQKNNLLCCAALAGKDDLIVALLQKGVNVNEPSALSFGLSPRACAVIGNLQPQTFDILPTQGVYGDDERVYALAKRHGYHYGENKLMTLLRIASAAVLRLLAN